MHPEHCRVALGWREYFKPPHPGRKRSYPRPDVQHYVMMWPTFGWWWYPILKSWLLGLSRSPNWPHPSEKVKQTTCRLQLTDPLTPPPIVNHKSSILSDSPSALSTTDDAFRLILSTMIEVFVLRLTWYRAPRLRENGNARRLGYLPLATVYSKRASHNSRHWTLSHGCRSGRSDEMDRDSASPDDTGIERVLTWLHSEDIDLRIRKPATCSYRTFGLINDLLEYLWVVFFEESTHSLARRGRSTEINRSTGRKRREMEGRRKPCVAILT